MQEKKIHVNDHTFPKVSDFRWESTGDEVAFSSTLCGRHFCKKFGNLHVFRNIRMSSSLQHNSLFDTLLMGILVTITRSTSPTPCIVYIQANKTLMSSFIIYF